MKSEFSLRFEKLNASIQKAFEVFTDNGRDPNVTEIKIKTYLQATEGIKGLVGESIKPSDRLSMLGQKCIDLGWDAMCKVYEFMIKTEPPDEQKTALVTWYATALSHFLSEKVALTFEERNHFADDMCRVLNNALNVSPNNANVAYSFGQLYLNHPGKQQNELEYLEKAAEWFAAAESWSRAAESDGEAYEALCALADTYFRLQSWEAALLSYQRLKRVRLDLQSTKTGDEFDTEIDHRIAECEKSLMSK